ncbi:MAG: stearoyl-CoA desaturase (delta-9 desaturase) [Halioglobus sp.]|jgi:stearoyl-CoA desaturase (delta-9 desaturase)
MIKNKITSGAGIAIICYHAFLLVSLPVYLYYNPPGLSLVLVSIALFFATGIGITAGYHRYYSHKAYKMKSIPEAVLLFFGTMATQGSALRWSYDHRKHHAFVDTDKDPYSIKKGFWYAHMWWLMDESPEIEPKVVSDLLKNKMVAFQHRHYYKLMVFTNILAFLVTGWALGDFLGAFFITLWVRLLTLHHCTWFINSLAHTWGSKSFSKEHSAVDNFLISLLTFGEGYHNYHHTFANDYRNGIRWYNFDPTKWLIWALHKTRLAWDLKKVDFFTVQNDWFWKMPKT